MAFYPAGTIIPSKLHLYHPESLKQNTFPILDLPGEIRNKIYLNLFEECLVDIKFSYQFDVCKLIEHPPASTQDHLAKGKTGLRHEDSKLERQQYDDDWASLMTAQNHCKHSSAAVQEPRGGNQPRGVKSRRDRQTSKKNRLRLGHCVLQSARNGTPSNYMIAFNFLCSNRQIYDEGLCFLYSQTAFRFASAAVIDKFLSTTPPKALKAIQMLDIRHRTYREPRLSRNRCVKEENDKRWLTTCRKMGEIMHDLRRLKIQLFIYDWPSRLALDEVWAKSILLLRGRGLDRVDAFLSHQAFSDEKLEEAARKLENAMMSPEGRLIKSAEDRKILQAKVKKAAWRPPRVLVIKMDDKATKAKTQH